jgi:K+-transporting ATPase A subunit
MRRTLDENPTRMTVAVLILCCTVSKRPVSKCYYFGCTAKLTSQSNHNKTLMFLVHVLLLFTTLSQKLIIYQTPEFGDRTVT